MNRQEFLNVVSKVDVTFEDEFKGEFNSPELLWDNFLKHHFEQLQQPVVVRGGAIEAQSVPLEGEALKWTNSSITQITPTEPLPAEGQEQNGRDGVMKWCDSCGKITYWLDGECENYKARGGSAKGVLPF